LTFTPISDAGKESLINLFNYYITNSDAAFLETSVPLSFFEQIRPLLDHYPSVSVYDEKGKLVGFGLTRPHNPMPAFHQTAVITYFIDPEFTGKGIGSTMLQILSNEARKKGIKTILAEISSRNEGSIRFHERHGFTHQGRFLRVGVKNGKEFDTIWMQKFI